MRLERFREFANDLMARVPALIRRVGQILTGPTVKTSPNLNYTIRNREQVEAWKQIVRAPAKGRPDRPSALVESLGRPTLEVSATLCFQPQESTLSIHRVGFILVDR